MKDDRTDRFTAAGTLSEVICLTVTCFALLGWLAHWNAYINLTLTLGSVGLWLTRWTAMSRG